MGSVTANKVWILSNPHPKSEVLLKVDKGQKVRVLKEKGSWLKVRIALDAEYSFEGWVSRRFVKWKRPKSVKRRTPKRKRVTPKPRIAKKRRPLVSKKKPTPIPLAEPRPKRRLRRTPIPRPTPSPPPRVSQSDLFFEKPESQPSKPKPPLRLSSVKEPKTVGETIRLSQRRPQIKKTMLSVGLDFGILQYKLRSGGATPSEVLSYTLPGFGFHIKGDYWFWTATDQSLRIGSELAYYQIFYRVNTGLRDANGNEFGTKQANNFSFDGRFRILGEFRPSLGPRSSALGISTGFQYFKFKADDVESDLGPVLVYVSQRTMSLLVGAYGQFPLGQTFRSKISIDTLPLNFVSESPTDTTGINPSGKIGFVPSLEISWVPSSSHQWTLGYEFRFQKYTFDGSRTRFGETVTEGRVQTLIHSLSLAYQYRF